jgi:hypothetical protein
MLVFLAPLALVGLGLLAVPVLVHLFKPRRVRVIPFSSLRWLRASRHKLSRRVQWHQVLLFLLRAGFLTLLVLALAKPVLNLGRGGRVMDRVLILDMGRTMAYEPPDRSPPLVLAREAAARLVREAPAHDRTAVLLAGARGSILIPPAPDPDRHAPRLHAVQADLSETDLAGALRLVPPLFADGSDRETTELVILTDLLAASWSQGGVARFLRDFNRPLRIRILDVGVGRPQNAWIARAELGAPGPGGRRTLTAILGAVGDQAHERVLRLSGLPGLADQTRKVSLESDRPTVVAFDLPAGLDPAGSVAQLALEPRDALASDDVFWLPTDPQGSLRVLVLEAPSTQVAELQPAFHLRVGLEALAAAAGGGLEIVTRTPAAVRPADLAAADAIILADIPALSDDALATLTDRVREGAGLAVFLGPGLDAAFHNTRLRTPLAPASSLLPVEVLERVDAGAGLARLSDLRWEHPLLEALADPAYGDLAGVGLRSFRRLRLDEGRSDVSVLARVNGEDPAMVAAAFGAGRVLVFNTTANDAWSDLPRRKSFVPLLDGLLTHLAGGWRRRTFTAGEAVVLPLPAGAESVTLTAPSGRELPPTLRQVAGKPVAQLDTTPELGVYRIRFRAPGGPRNLPFVVQAGRRGSPLARISEGTLRRWWEPAELEIVAAEPGSDAALRLPWRRAFEPWLLLLAFVALLAEMALVHRVCPKAPPPVTDRSRIAEDGFFGPEPPPEEAGA